MVVREARVSDARRIAEIHADAWKCVYRGMLPDRVLDSLSVERGERNWEAKLTDGTDEVLVVEREGRVIGFAAFGARRDDDADDRTGEIYAIYLEPGEWRAGYGSALAKAAMTSLQERGFSEVTLWVLEANQAARRFYEAMRFEVDGATKVDRRRDGTELHEVRYRVSLANGRSAAEYD